MASLPRIAALLLVAAGGCLISPDPGLLKDASRGEPAGATEAGVADLLADLAGGADLVWFERAAPDISSTERRPAEARLPDQTRPPDQIGSPDQGPLPVGKGNARLLYGESGNKLSARIWDVVAGTWAPATSLPVPASKNVSATVNKISPVLLGDEAGAVLVEDAAGTSLGVLGRSGTGWKVDWSSTAIVPVHADKRGFDLEYEPLSGDLLVVYSRNGATPAFRTRTGSAWSAEQVLPLNDGAGPHPDVNSGAVLWVELVARPGSNEIALTYADANADLVAMVWNGSSWDTASVKVVATDLKVSPSSNLVHQRAFDAAWETASGDLLVAWGRQPTGQFGSMTRSASTKTWSSAQLVTVVSGLTEYVDLESHPAIDSVSATLIDQGAGTERLGLGVWNGSAWVNLIEADSQIRDVNDTAFGDFPGAVAWAGSSGTAVCVYSDNQTGTLDWARWTAATGWVVEADLAIAGKGYTESVVLQPVPGQGKILGVLSDSNGALWSALFDGVKWTLLNGGAALTTQLSSIASLPFSLDLQVK